jgi:hypothetical protein
LRRAQCQVERPPARRARCSGRYGGSKCRRIFASAPPFGAIAFSTTHTDGQSVRVPSAGIVIRAAARIEPHAAPGTMLCTEEFLSELDERSRLLFTPVTQVPLQGAGLLLGDDGAAVIRKNDHEEPVETRLFQAPLG